MNKEGIIRMARELGFVDMTGGTVFVPQVEQLYHTAYKAGAIAEREECAKVCDEYTTSDFSLVAIACAGRIRARGQV